MSLILAIVMGGLCIALLGVNLSTARDREHVDLAQRSFYAAEAGLSDAYVQLSEGLIAPPSGGNVVTLGGPGAGGSLGKHTSYSVLIAETAPRGFSLQSTGVDGADQTLLELIVTEKPTGFFQFAAFGSEGVVLDSNAFVDSYDSADGSYDSQIQGGNEYAKENGDIGSNSDIVLKANTEVHGDAKPGVGHVVNDFAPNTYVSGSMDPLEEPFPFPPIDTPVFSSPSPGGALVAGANTVLGPGDIQYDSILAAGGSTITIVGPARVVADDFQMKSNSELIFDATNGEIELYAEHDFVLESNSKVTTLSDSALDVTLFLNGDNIQGGGDKVDLAANSDFIGAIYAPNAEFSLASNFTIYGSIMCGKLDLSSFGEIHFDEALLYDGYGATGELESKLWRRRPIL